MKSLNFFLIFFCLISVHIHSQKRQTFQNLPDYLANVKELGVNEEKIVVLSKEDNEALAEDIGKDGFYTFYGIVNDSQLISAGKLENKSCWGQFRDLCASINNASVGTKVEDISYLKTIPFDKEKKTIIFLYSYKLGKRGVKNYINPILEGIEKDTSFDYILLSLDISNILSYR